MRPLSRNLSCGPRVLRTVAPAIILLNAILGGWVLAFADSPVAASPALAAGEFELRENWAARLMASQQSGAPSHIVLIEQDAPDAISRGQSWRKTPFRIGEKTYEHGLAFNANKRLRIYLDKPGARFTSDAGLENNDDTRGDAGKGSVTFHVIVAGKEVFASPVLKLKDGPRPIDVPLDGAKEFEIRVGDGGDGRAYDQALWGGSEIHLQDGARLRLQDLPSADGIPSNPERISFVYGDKPGSALLGSWKRLERESRRLGGITLQEVTWRDPATGLEVRVSSKRFKDFPATEWVARFKNTGSKDSPVLENIQVLDTAFTLPETKPAMLHWATGGVHTFDDFAPHTTELKQGAPFALAATEARSSGEYLPFFNLEGDGAGVVLAVGWTGRWTAKFEAVRNGSVRMVAGMSRTHLVLHPGEEIRTPSMLALFYKGDRWRGQNLLRRFILAHHRPLKQGEPLMAPITYGNWGGTHADVHLSNIQNIIRERLPMDYYWIDAGWYGRPEPEPLETWAANVGDWRVKTGLHPQGFKMLSDILRKDGRELMVWFEPERVFKNTPWHKEHPDWVSDIGGDNLLMDLGQPEARAFVADFISSRIAEFGLGCYRQDFNMDPGPYWDKNDAASRQGMSEIRHIEGLYAFWDTLLARDPNLIIDNCASGGRRIDLETTGRSTPFWRTDGPRDPIAHQCHTYGLLAWVPFSATSQDIAGDDYEFRSSMCSSLCINWEHSGDGPQKPYRKDFPYDWARKTLNQYISIRDNYYGDYYPLTAYSQADDVWMTYQLDRPEAGRGLIVALRRPRSPYESARFVLHGLEPAATYAFTDLDTPKTARLTGAELMKSGLPIAIAAQPGSALVTYNKVDNSTGQ